MKTLRDVMRDKQLASAEFDARIDSVEAENKRIEEILKAHPEIGVLNGGKYYVFNGSEYIEARDPAHLVRSNTERG